jgi:hypothetical protein
MLGPKLEPMAIRSRQQKHKEMKTHSIDVNRKDVLNPFDHAYLDKTDLGSKAPIINYSTVVSDFNLNVQKNRQRKRAEAEQKFKAEQE